MESPHGKATEHECARGKVDVVWFRPRPEDGSRRCRMGSAASMGPNYHAEPRRSPRGMPVTHLSPLGTLRRAVTRPASMADVQPPRTQRLCVHIPPFGAHGGNTTPGPSALCSGRTTSLRREPANGCQPTRRVAVRMSPMAGSRRSPSAFDDPETEIQDRKVTSKLRQDDRMTG